MHTPKTFFIDMDGVLTDFYGGALRAHNYVLPFREIQERMDVQMGLTVDEFWTPFGFEFWASLEWTKEGREIIKMAEDIFHPDRIGILSNPSERRGVDAGKRAWVRRHIPRYAHTTFLGAGKYIAASPSKILLDDFDHNVVDFRKAGGHAVLVPRPWNARHPEVTEADSFDLEALANELLAIVRGE